MFNLTPGRVLDRRYQIVNQLGVGGFGATYLAVDLHRHREHVVVKQLLLQGQSDPGKAGELFEQEAKLLGKLGGHSQIPRLESYFIEDRSTYIVQEYIEGTPLSGVPVPMNETEVFKILLQILGVLKFVHEAGVIHRDVKPANIMRRTDGTLMLIDFGVAKLRISPSQGTRVCSGGYTAPEQLVGQAYPQSDLYALGMTCISLLTGQQPENLIDPVTMRVTWKERLGVSISNLRMAQVLDRMVEYDPGRRYSRAELAIGDLTSRTSVIGTEVVSPRPGHQTQAVVYQPRSSGSLSSVLLGVLLTVGVVTGVTMYHRTRVPEGTEIQPTPIASPSLSPAESPSPSPSPSPVEEKRSEEEGRNTGSKGRGETGNGSGSVQPKPKVEASPKKPVTESSPDQTTDSGSTTPSGGQSGTTVPTNPSPPVIVVPSPSASPSPSETPSPSPSPSASPSPAQSPTPVETKTPSTDPSPVETSSPEKPPEIDTTPNTGGEITPPQETGTGQPEIINSPGIYNSSGPKEDSEKTQDKAVIEAEGQ